MIIPCNVSCKTTNPMYLGLHVFPQPSAWWSHKTCRNSRVPPGRYQGQRLWSPFRHWNRPTFRQGLDGAGTTVANSQHFTAKFWDQNEQADLGVPYFQTKKQVPKTSKCTRKPVTWLLPVALRIPFSGSIPPRAEPRTPRVFQGCCCTSARGRRGSRKCNTCSGHSMENSAFPCLSSTIPASLQWWSQLWWSFWCWSLPWFPPSLRCKESSRPLQWNYLGGPRQPAVPNWRPLTNMNACLQIYYTHTHKHIYILYDSDHIRAWACGIYDASYWLNAYSWSILDHFGTNITFWWINFWS